MINSIDVKETVERFLADKEGYFIVACEVQPQNRIVVEIDHSEQGVDIETCVALNRAIEATFDREVEDYELEVSSAGITSPLRHPLQYAKYVGKPMIVTLPNGERVKGHLSGADADSFILTTEMMVKSEGERRKRLVSQEHRWGYADVKSVVYDLKV